MSQTQTTQPQEAPQKKKVILSGIQPTSPTGSFTLGNYIGAVRNWVQLQEDYDCYYMIANMHAITVRQDSANLRKQILSSYALILACGVDPEKSIAFIQSHVHEHAELSWILSCYTQFGELSRMTQFKDKSAKNAHNINAGLFTYPSLMAADILLYQADLVPVGADQKQHLELTRDIAERFNGLYSPTFVVPEGYIPKAGAKVMSLANPEKKMSKSDETPNAVVSVLDDADAVIRKFKRAVTDSGSCISFTEGSAGIQNLLTIYQVITGKEPGAIEAEFAGMGYGQLKEAVGVAVADYFAPIRDTHKRLIADKGYLEKCYLEGAQKASYVARKTLEKVYRKVGFVATPRF